ncbi:unnamed protein product [Pylaiella littoralis]
MLGTVRAGVRSARPTARPGRPSRISASVSLAFSAEPLRLGLLPPHPRSVRGVSRLPRRSAAAGHFVRRVNGGVQQQQPFHACSGRPTTAGCVGGQGRWSAATTGGGKDGEDGESSSSSSDSSDSSDDDDENEEKENRGKTASPEGSLDSSGGSDNGSDRDDNKGVINHNDGGGQRQAPTNTAGAVPRGPASGGGNTNVGRGGKAGAAAAAVAATAAELAEKSRGSSSSNRSRQRAGAAEAHEGVDAFDTEGEEGEQSEERYDYRSIGSEIYEGGDVEAGEMMEGSYDFVDDIVETQHVPIIQDPFDHKGRFHRCPGKRQGKAALPSTCQIFDIRELHVNHIPLLKRFVNDAGMILGRYRTGLCAKCQRKVAGTIKASRQMGFVPTISDHEVRDTGPGGLFAWAGKDGDHDAMAKAKAKAEMEKQKKENKRFGSLA